MPDESTTPDLVELAQRLTDGTHARDFDALISLYAHDAVFDMSSVGMGAFEGQEAICRLFEDWLGSYEAFELQFEEVRDLGHGVAFSVVRQRGRLPGSANWIEVRYAVVATAADGLIERSMGYADIDEARAAAERLAGELED
jgi:ketosteroid isomerase-like protein